MAISILLFPLNTVTYQIRYNSREILSLCTEVHQHETISDDCIGMFARMVMS